MAVHIVVWVVEHGPIPPRKQIDHTCKNRLCVELDHLEMVTHRTNQKRRDMRRMCMAVEERSHDTEC